MSGGDNDTSTFPVRYDLIVQSIGLPLLDLAPMMLTGGLPAAIEAGPPPVCGGPLWLSLGDLGAPSAANGAMAPSVEHIG